MVATSAVAMVVIASRRSVSWLEAALLVAFYVYLLPFLS